MLINQHKEEAMLINQQKEEATALDKGVTNQLPRREEATAVR